MFSKHVQRFERKITQDVLAVSTDGNYETVNRTLSCLLLAAMSATCDTLCRRADTRF